MKVEVAAPVEYQGAVMATLQRRHGIIRAQESTQDYFTVLCEVSAHMCHSTGKIQGACLKY